MEDTSGQLPLITSEEAHHLVLCFPTVYHQGQPCLDGPLHLLFEGFQLFVFVFAAPIIVEADLTNGYEGGGLVLEVTGDELTDCCELLLPVGLDFFRVQACHGIEETGMAGTEVKDTTGCGEVDGWQEDLFHSCLPGPLDDIG